MRCSFGDIDKGPSKRRHEKAAKIWEGRRPRIIEMIAEGKTQTEIAKEFGVSQWGVSNWIRKMKIRR